MARNPIVSATLQAALLGATSNVVSQLMACGRKQTPPEVDWIPVLQFLIFSIISAPPNFAWQSYLESSFPARPLSSRKRRPEKSDEEPPADGHNNPPLSLRNTLAKLLLDQTLGAAVNTLLFSTYMHSIHLAMEGAPRVTTLGKAVSYWLSPGAIDFSAVDVRVVLGAAVDEFWTIVLAGLKLWPAVGLLNFTLVKTVEGRSLVGCIAGLGWGVYMSMVAAR